MLTVSAKKRAKTCQRQKSAGHDYNTPIKRRRLKNPPSLMLLRKLSRAGWRAGAGNELLRVVRDPMSELSNGFSFS